jgi:pantoate--beta-alanine ligase
MAGTLRAALKAGEQAWMAGSTKNTCMKSAMDVVDTKKKEIQDLNLGVDVRLEYIEINDSRSFDILDSGSSGRSHPDPMILSGTLWVGKTRLIDNILLGDSSEILR